MIEKNKREEPKDFVGWKSKDKKLEVVGIYEQVKGKPVKFKVICTECSKDLELFPDGYFVSTKSNLNSGRKPCGCSKSTKWKHFQYLILARRAGKKKGFVVHGFSEEFKNSHTKLNLECLKDGYKWTASVDNIINGGTGCPKCSGNIRLEEQYALQKCINICKEMDYEVIGFPEGYINAHSYFEYVCKTHEKQTVTYNSFVNGGTRCIGCWKDTQLQTMRDNGNGNGYFPERKDDQDFLYVLDFNSKFIKVGRSFDIKQRLKSLRTESGIKKIYKLRTFTATHQEIYDYEQELHSELRERNFQHYIDWSTECFENESLFILNKLLDNCGLEEVNI